MWPEEYNMGLTEYEKDYIRERQRLKDMSLYFNHFDYLQNFNKNKEKEKPFIILYKSKPIQGIVLELWGTNPKYDWEGDMKYGFV